MEQSLNYGVFKQLLEQPENKKCVDCGILIKGTHGPQWVSVNNGVFICLNCSGIHRGLGVQATFVRSATMDSFSKKQLTMMNLGGNKNFLEFIEFYKLANESAYNKYNSKACEFYRKRVFNHLS